jgi:outer membrane protein assembly factor BamB
MARQKRSSAGPVPTGIVAAVGLAAAVVGMVAATTAGEPLAAKANHQAAAEAIYEATGVRGGLVVHLGCGDGRLTAALRAGESYLVHGLDTDPARVEQTRALLHARGLYGPVSAAAFNGRDLPYVGDTVNLLVAADLGEVATEEVRRVLAPGGVAYVRQEGRWQKTVKPRPAELGEWTHFLHDAGGNAVAPDARVGPPRRLRWVAEPRWSRSHEIPTSVQGVVTASGRLFTIFDEAPAGVYRGLPWRVHLVARDAFNGVLLWKTPLRDWQPESGAQFGRGDRWQMHHTIPRRLIAEGERVYVTLGFLDSPVSVLDAATGRVLVEALDGTRGADEMLLCDGVLVVKIPEELSVGASVRYGRDAPHDTLCALDAATGKLLWRKERVRVVPYALSALSGRVVYHNLEELVCLDARTGEERWRTPNDVGATVGAASTLVVHDGTVLFHGHLREAGERGLALTALSLEDGTMLWRRPGRRGQAEACTQPTDLFVIDGVVWCGGSLEGYDLRTGEVAKTLSIGKLISPGHHYRCHRSKATERYLIWPKRGAEFVDLQGEEHMRHDWLRAPCFTGATPANGLFYAPPSQCFCYPGVKIPGYLALSAEPAEALRPAAEAQSVRGIAYGQVAPGSRATQADWPMYRRDGRRSGSTPTPVPAAVGKLWEVDLSAPGTQPVVVGDRLFVAEKDAHRLRCLDAGSGKDVWSFTAGGRIDSSPTWHDGTVLFGCRDGWVYCLRADDGALVWRFQAAPDARRIVSYGQLESVWPVHGSVLVQEGIVYFAAGRSSFLDGGILVYALDARTGRPLHHHHLDGPWPNVREDLGSPFAMEGALPDLVVSDGRDLYMKRVKFDARLNRLPTVEESPLGELDMGENHLVATGGFLDDTGFDRLYWMHSHRWPGFYFAQHAPKSGQLVVFDDSTTYAVKYFYRRIVWSPAFFPATDGYLLFADDNDNQPVLEKEKFEKGIPGFPAELFEKWRERLAAHDDVEIIRWLPEEAYTDQHRRGGRGAEKGSGYQRAQPAKWQKMIPLRVRAMVLAGDLLFAAGLPDVIEPDDPLAALAGRRGAVLQVFSAADGSPVGSRQLDSPPAFDGLSAAGGRLYLVTGDGKLLCLGG